ncbi:MAG: hypothetical protein DMG91_07555 [Acidobacteria bacterium]|nr:MAG: hypothetical protein DMG91_07555 [Acidobacteriota bacterium]
MGASNRAARQARLSGIHPRWKCPRTYPHRNPQRSKHTGLASALAERALHWAREKGYKVDVICPFVHEYAIDQSWFKKREEIARLARELASD